MDESALSNMLTGSALARNNDGMSGSWGMWIVILLFLLGMGGNGLFGRGGTPANVATQGDVFASTAFSQTQDAVGKVASAVGDVNQNITSLGYTALAQSNAINQNISQQGADTRLQICQSTGAITQGQANVGFLVQNTGQQIERNIDQARFEGQQGVCAITSNDTANTQKVLDKLCQMEANMQATRIQELTVANQALNLQLGQQQQTATIIGAIRPYPAPSYPVSSPYQSLFGGYWGNGFSYGNFS